MKIVWIDYTFANHTTSIMMSIADFTIKALRNLSNINNMSFIRITNMYWC